MIEELKSTRIMEKVGGRFKLSALIQKRLLEIMQGARPLIEDTEGKTAMEIVVDEIVHDKIAIDHGTGKGDIKTLKL
jgi:DNA-directed RNA polymerase subunit omega